MCWMMVIRLLCTLGDLIWAKSISTGARSSQWLGQMSDTSLQQLSKDKTTKGNITGVDVADETGGRLIYHP